MYIVAMATQHKGNIRGWSQVRVHDSTKAIARRLIDEADANTPANAGVERLSMAQLFDAGIKLLNLKVRNDLQLIEPGDLDIATLVGLVAGLQVAGHDVTITRDANGDLVEIRVDDAVMDPTDYVRATMKARRYVNLDEEGEATIQ